MCPDDLGFPDLASDSDVDDDATTPGQDLVDLLIELLAVRTLSCRLFCLICFLAGQAGIAEARRYGKVGLQSGKYSEFLKRHLPFMGGKQNQYLVEVPSYLPHLALRAKIKVPVAVPHEEIHDFLQRDIGHLATTNILW